MPSDDPDSVSVDYFSPHTQTRHSWNLQQPSGRPDLLNENIARIEALKLQAMNAVGLSQEERHLFLRELDLLRSSFIQVTSSQPRLSAGEVPSAAAPAHYLAADELELEGILGQSPKIAQILKILAKVAPSELTVLLEGETGTGKELFARIIHLNSQRERFLAVNCGAFPANMIESELFGHVRGAFTGATADRKGRFEEANGGTIFLDEIGELDPLAQVKLLRVLEVGEIQRVGSDTHTSVDVRVIAATNRDLETMVEEGTFREDLYFRINICPLYLPPLRERRDEIDLLIRFFMEETCARGDRKPPKLDRELRDFLVNQYDYPGNIRELKNIALFLAAMAQTGKATMADLPNRYLRGMEMRKQSKVTEEAGAQEQRRALVREAEKSYWIDLLEKHRGKITAICRETGLSRSRVYQILDGFELKPSAFRH